VRRSLRISGPIRRCSTSHTRGPCSHSPPRLLHQRARTPAWPRRIIGERGRMRHYGIGTVMAPPLVASRPNIRTRRLSSFPPAAVRLGGSVSAFPTARSAAPGDWIRVSARDGGCDRGSKGRRPRGEGQH
jgi:hypothetical protein